MPDVFVRVYISVASPTLYPKLTDVFYIAVRFQLDQVKKEFNALNKQIADVRKVWTHCRIFDFT